MVKTKFPTFIYLVLICKIGKKKILEDTSKRLGFVQEKLIDEAVEILTASYKNVEREFQHGHFGVSDLLKTENGEVVILSNLYWSWKPPFYDAVFGYHWFVYNLAKIKNVTPELIREYEGLWLSKINNLPKNDWEKKLLNLAFLERAAAGLNLDALSVNQKSPIAEYLLKLTRKNLKTFLLKL